MNGYRQKFTFFHKYKLFGICCCYIYFIKKNWELLKSSIRNLYGIACTSYIVRVPYVFFPVRYIDYIYVSHYYSLFLNFLLKFYFTFCLSALCMSFLILPFTATISAINHMINKFKENRTKNMLIANIFRCSVTSVIICLIARRLTTLTFSFRRRGIS